MIKNQIYLFSTTGMLFYFFVSSVILLATSISVDGVSLSLQLKDHHSLAPYGCLIVDGIKILKLGSFHGKEFPFVLLPS